MKKILKIFFVLNELKSPKNNMSFFVFSIFGGSDPNMDIFIYFLGFFLLNPSLILAIFPQKSAFSKNLKVKNMGKVFHNFFADWGNNKFFGRIFTYGEEMATKKIFQNREGLMRQKLQIAYSLEVDSTYNGDQKCGCLVKRCNPTFRPRLMVTRTS